MNNLIILILRIFCFVWQFCCLSLKGLRLKLDWSRLFVLIIMYCVLSIDSSAQFSSMGGMNNVSSHDHSEEEEQEQRPKIKQFQGNVFRGLSIHADVGMPIISLLGGYARSYEMQIDVNLYRSIYPIFEFGYATAKKEAISGIVYDTKAPFFRVGLNYSLLKPFKDDGNERSVKSYPFVGVRYAMSPIMYNLLNVEITDEYWGTTAVEDFRNNVKYAGWLEVVGGVRVDLFKGLTIGWSVRLKTLLHTTAPDESYVWYVPGYGKSSKMGFMFNYTIGYTFYKE